MKILTSREQCQTCLSIAEARIELKIYFKSAHPELDKYQALKEYKTFGGLPRVCLESDVRKKMEYLKSLFRKTYLTDIKERYSITEDALMKHQDDNGIYWMDIFDFLT